MTKHLFSYIQFLAWPVVAGTLFALVIVQYQQLQKFADMLPATVADSRAQAPAAPGTAAPLASSVTPAQSAPRPLSFAEAIKIAKPSVVSISATSVSVESVEQAGDDEVNFYLGQRDSSGSGVIISDLGYILTNLHVVETLFNAFDTKVTLFDGTTIPAQVIGWDKANDLAVLHINMDNLTPITLGDETDLEVGDVVFAIGYPRNIGQSTTQGIVSALGINQDRESKKYLIQTDAAINPGNSGGALIDRAGHLVGINSSIFSESGYFEGIGFATPVSAATRIMNELIRDAVASNFGYLGVITGEALNAQSSELLFGSDNIRGMLVENVDVGGAAAQAGVLPGDVLTQVEDTPVLTEQSIIMEVQKKKPGDTLKLKVYRNGQVLDMTTTLGFGKAIVIEPPQ